MDLNHSPSSESVGHFVVRHTTQNTPFPIPSFRILFALRVAITSLNDYRLEVSCARGCLYKYLI